MPTSSFGTREITVSSPLSSGEDDVSKDIAHSLRLVQAFLGAARSSRRAEARVIDIPIPRTRLSLDPRVASDEGTANQLGREPSLFSAL
jgi:hypothetical protein